MNRKPLAECRGTFPIHPIYFIAPFAFIAWIIALSGLAATMSECSDGMSSSVCGASYGLEWTVVVFEVVMLVITVLTVPTKFFVNFRFLLTAIFVILTTIYMQSAQEALYSLKANENFYDTRDSYRSAVQASAAGFVLVIIVNLLLIAYLTLDVFDMSGTGADGPAAIIKTLEVPVANMPSQPALEPMPYPAQVGLSSPV